MNIKKTFVAALSLTVASACYSATEVTVSGTKSDAEMTISTGWNLVGPVENSSAPAEATIIYNWNEIYESIATDQGVLLQGVGYWIFSF